ncbi:dihydropteroate synthase [Apibacter raozihei]|uniref:dihydropteroate synthase n=1 Tax=Apibacter raozihei TaxID=2500547 RepID=UPI000FE2FEEB|nr:dihydropteroate synthase [Apibacter raozihei]
MTINLNGQLINFDVPKIAGILNLTPDSFFDGGKYKTIDHAIIQVEKLLDEGADLIDIGGQSTRPGSKLVSDKEEIDRILPVVKELVRRFPDIKISIDTFWSRVAEQTVNEGAAMINDISGGTIDSRMFPTMGRLNIPYVLMHMRGTPQTMNSFTDYNNLILDINFYFSEKLNELRNQGVTDILLDPGFGFSKNIDQNFELMKNLDKLAVFNLPIYVGISRKRMIYQPLNVTAEEALTGTAAVNLYALQKGANILRAHDVKEAKQVIKLWNLLK